MCIYIYIYTYIYIYIYDIGAVETHVCALTRYNNTIDVDGVKVASTLSNWEDKGWIEKSHREILGRALRPDTYCNIL